jgi:hypothetical protein
MLFLALNGFLKKIFFNLMLYVVTLGLIFSLWTCVSIVLLFIYCFELTSKLLSSVKRSIAKTINRFIYKVYIIIETIKDITKFLIISFIVILAIYACILIHLGISHSDVINIIYFYQSLLITLLLDIIKTIVNGNGFFIIFYGLMILLVIYIINTLKIISDIVTKIIHYLINCIKKL